jgi:molybdopterin-containing oxidoreductase family iron-sulfur binding subunit
LDLVLLQLRLQLVKVPNKSIPYVLQPEQIIPGVADYYATSVLMVLILQTYLLKLVKRPIKIDNNNMQG